MEVDNQLLNKLHRLRMALLQYRDDLEQRRVKHKADDWAMGLASAQDMFEQLLREQGISYDI